MVLQCFPFCLHLCITDTPADDPKVMLTINDFNGYLMVFQNSSQNQNLANDLDSFSEPKTIQHLAARTSP